MSISSLYEPIRPTLNLNFARSRRLDPRITFTRASTGTFVDRGGVLKTALTDQPRFTHDPSTGESLGLLIEEARTNLLLRSEEFDDASWTKSNTSISVNTAVAPDGNTAADSLIEDTATAEHNITQVFTAVSGTSYTLSVFAKSIGGNRAIKLRFTTTAWTGSINTQVDFNLATGAGTAITGSPTFSSQSFPGGWWRFRMTATSTANGTPSAGVHLIEGVANPISYTGDGTSGIFIWGAQLEAGAFPTSYIPTTSSTATRSADVCAITGSNFSRWYRQDESTVYVDCALPEGSATSSSATRTVVDLTDGTVSNRLAIRSILNAALTDQITIRSNGGTAVNLTTGATVGTTPRKIAAGFRASDYAAAGTDASSVATLSSGAMPLGVDQMTIGSIVTLSNANYHSGTVSRLTYWPSRLPDAVLQRLTR